MQIIAYEAGQERVTYVKYLGKAKFYRELLNIACWNFGRNFSMIKRKSRDMDSLRRVGGILSIELCQDELAKVGVNSPVKYVFVWYLMERVLENNISKIFLLPDRMKTNSEMVCLRNFKRCRPPDWSVVKLIHFFMIVSKYIQCCCLGQCWLVVFVEQSLLPIKYFDCCLSCYFSPISVWDIRWP